MFTHKEAKLNISLTNAPVSETGMKSQISWHSLRSKLPSNTPNYEIVGFTASPEGLLIHWEYKRP